MDSKQVNQTIEIIPLLGYELKKAGGYHVGTCPFCGGDDRFTVKHTKDGDRWHCRQCGDGKYHTAIDYIMRRDNVPFKTALQTLGGDTLAARPIPQAERPKPQPKPITLPSADWQASALAEITAAADALNTSEAARAFLSSRALLPSTWDAWLFGFMFYSPKNNPTIKIPVITLPWYEWDAGGEVITAVKYRVMNGNSKLRYFSKEGSKFDVPFGLSYALESHHTLLLVEGELNCASAWQSQPEGVTCLSFGSEGGGDVRILQSLASRYQNVFVWADDVWDNPKHAQRAKELRALVRGRGVALRSVKQDEIKQDANQLLKVGALPEFLSRVLGVECENIRGKNDR